MQISGKHKDNYPLLLAVVILSVILLFSFNASYNNKYTLQTPQGKNGVLDLRNTDTDFLYLISGWEFYQYRLLTPEEIHSQSPACSDYVSIGQHGGFELGDKAKNPHGSATYRLTILTSTDSPQMLEVPEIYSSCRIWINGELVTSLGSVDPASYKRGIANTLITIPSSYKIEIVIQATDQDSLYSGLTYPPAFGNPPAVTKFFILRLLIYAMAFTVTILIGVFYLLTQMKTKQKKTAVLFFLLCIFYAGYISYPLVHAMGFDNYYWYRLESFSLYAMLFILIIQQGAICRIPGKCRYPMAAASLLVCLAVLIMPMLWKDNINIMLLYSKLIMYYKWVTAGYLILSTMAALLDKTRYSRRLLAGFGIMGSALAIDRIFPLYEPIVAGWPLEIAGFIIVLLLFSILFSETVSVYRSILALKEQEKYNKHQLAVQQEQYQRLITSIEVAAKNRHDLRHHILAIRSLAENQDQEILLNYLDQFENHFKTASNLIVCQNHAVNSILVHYLTLAKEEEIPTKTDINLPDDLGGITEITLCVILGNSLENALEASRRMVKGNAHLQICIQRMGSMLSITIDNNCENIALPVANGGFLSDKRNRKESGLGVLNIRTAVEQCNGIVKFETLQKEFRISILLPINSNQC